MLERHPVAHGPLPTRPGGRILLVEDDSEIAREVAAELEARGHAVDRLDSGRDVRARLDGGGFDLLVMDRMLPEMDGAELVRELRAQGCAMPILVISALGAVDDRVCGLEVGGDDYLTKPFALAELGARVEALLRRPLHGRETVLVAGPIRLDLIERAAWRAGQRLDLLPREFQLLHYLMGRPNQVVTRAMLLENVWHYRFVPQTNLVDVHVGRLRRKLDAPGEPSMIESVRGLGFLFREAP